MIPTALVRLFQLMFKPVWFTIYIPNIDGATPKKVTAPLFTALLPQLVIVFPVTAEAPPISFEGLMNVPIVRNKIGLFISLMALP